MRNYISTMRVRLIRRLRRRGYRIGTTNGCFDLLHPGHVQYLRDCKRILGPKSILVVLVNDDAYLLRVKGRIPVFKQNRRQEMVDGVKGVFKAYLFKESDPAKWIRRIQPDVHFKGMDWKDKDCPEAKYAGEMRFVPLLPGYSTSAIIAKIRKGTE